MSKSLPHYITIGYVEKAHGIKGELRVKPLTDYPPRFKDLSSLQLEYRNGSREQVVVERVEVQRDVIYVKLAGIDSRDDATQCKGAYLNIKRDEALPLSADDFYYFEVIGFAVKTTGGRELGSVKEVLDLPANAVLVVVSDGDEFLIPVIPEVMRNVDRANALILIHAVEGLLD